jgi:membrane-associated protease RseP (regulator of RpoE activity)
LKFGQIKRGTRWRLNWLPLGGFVKFVGEMQAPTDTREHATEPETAASANKVKPAQAGRPPLHRVLVR